MGAKAPYLFFVEVVMNTCISKEPLSTCPECHNNSIVLYDTYGRIINYKEYLLKYSLSEINKKFDLIGLSHMKCSKCRKQFIIDWRNILPIPLTTNVSDIYYSNE
jgi:hypothetical protein